MLVLADVHLSVEDGERAGELRTEPFDSVTQTSGRGCGWVEKT
jgi:hypothetical protein